MALGAPVSLKPSITTAVLLNTTGNDYAKMTIQGGGQTMRVEYDGTVPTTTTGFQVFPAAGFVIEGGPQINNARAVAETGTATPVVMLE